MPGSPIRTPWDHSSVDSSPRPIAASHVLHRLLVPRHPPYALKNLTTKSFKDARIHCAILNQHQTRTSLSATTSPTTAGRFCDRCGSRLNQPPRTLVADCFRTQQGACMISRPHPPSVPRPGFLRSSTKTIVNRCQGSLRQCLRHMSTPPPHSGGAGSSHPFG
jgi:hypothetical protein